MTIPDPKYRLGAVVFHVCDAQPGVVVGYLWSGSALQYRVRWGTSMVEEHQEMELTLTRPDWDRDEAWTDSED